MKNEPKQIDCEEALRRLAAHIDGELTAMEAAEVDRHLERCRSCFSRAEFERRLKARIREDLCDATVPAECEERLRALLRSLQEAG